jgi:pilus assembly protein CpaE
MNGRKDMAADKVRILIVDDIAETRENIRKLLQFESDVDVVGAARSGKEGIQLAQELDPDVVLMDINMPDIDGITATDTIRKKSPHIQVVILSVQSDQNYMRKAMLAGARDFLPKPPLGNELISAIRRAGEMAHAERAKGVQQQLANIAAAGVTNTAAGFSTMSRGKIITVYSPKGGTGCTTISVNLAIALNNEDTRTALVDANLQFGDVAIFVNEQGKNTILELAPQVDELEADIVEEILIKHAASGLRILAAPQRPEMADKVSAEQFTKVVQYLQKMYAYIVIDTSHILSDVVLSMFDISDVIVLVTTQEIPSIKNARLFLDLLQNMGIGKDRVVFAMNRYDKRIGITPERVSENLKHEISVTIPLDEKIVITAVNRGVPFMLDNKAQPVGRGIFSLAEAVRARLTALESETEVSGSRR